MEITPATKLSAYGQKIYVSAYLVFVYSSAKVRCFLISVNLTVIIFGISVNIFV